MGEVTQYLDRVHGPLLCPVTVRLHSRINETRGASFSEAEGLVAGRSGRLRQRRLSREHPLQTRILARGA